MTDLEKSCYPFAVLFFGIFLGSEVLTVNGSTDSQTNIRYFLYQSAEYPRDCQEAVSQCSSNNVKSGVYLIKPDQYPEPFEVYCDNNGTSTGWTVIQRRRFDGSIGYTRNWNDFKYGFGFLGSEFWMGNEKLAHLTNQKRYKLLINMENEEGQSYNVTYDDFRITDEWGNYSLSSVGIFNKSTEFNITWCVTNRQIKTGSICERSCENPKVCIPSNPSEMERCVCQGNYMIHEGSCIPIEECGCYVSTNNTVLMEGESYINSDCSSRITCSNNRLTRANYGCHEHATCEETNGVGECICREWFEGDGVNECERIGPRDCSHLYRAGRRRDDVYTIYPRDGSEFNVSCEMSDGGWTILQKRTGGDLSFYRPWDDYKNGFGSPGGDHWLGNDKIHKLTSQDTYQLLIEKTNSAGASYHTRYSSFSISNEAEKYRLSLGTYSGNAGNNAMGASSGYRFSTRDQDNDGSSTFDCAEKHRGGWWYPDDSSTGTTENCYSFSNRAGTGSYEYSDCGCFSGCRNCATCFDNGRCCPGCGGSNTCCYYSIGSCRDGCSYRHRKCNNCDGCSGTYNTRWCRNKNEIYETTNYSCGYSNLNGDYQYNDQRGIFWKNLQGSDCGITQTTMKISTTQQ